MSKTDKDNLNTLQSRYGSKTIANNFTTSTAGTAILDAFQGYILWERGLMGRGYIAEGSNYQNDTDNILIIVKLFIWYNSL